MTYVQYVNCNKWKNIIGISLWVSLTVLLILGLYFGYQGYSNHLIVPREPDIGEPMAQFEKELNAYANAKYTNDFNDFIFGISVIGHLINTPVIWFVTNRHYRWIEIKCGIKPTDTSSKPSMEKEE